MARNSSGAKNQPQYAGTGGLSTAADLSEIANYAALVGNRKALPNADRVLAAGADVWEGLDWYETDLGSTYRFMGGIWVLYNLPWVDFTPSVSGFATGAGGALLYSKCRVVNGECDTRIGWRLGTSPTVNDPTVAYPVPVASWMNDLAPIGAATFYDQSASTNGRIHGELYKTSTGIRVVSAGPPMAPLGAATPFTWTLNDEIHIDAKYPV